MSEKPSPQIFAIMRNGHEVIRGDSRDVRELLVAGDAAGAKQRWEDMRKWETLHAFMEEGTTKGESSPLGFFHVLDQKCQNVATENDLFSQHEDLEKKSSEISSLLDEKSDDPDAILKIFDEFASLNEAHLKKEEDIMMPKVMEMKKAGVPLKKVMMEDLLPAVKDDEEFFFGHACSTLEKHHENMPRARVFAHALFAASTPEQWSSRKEIVKSSLSDTTWAEIEGLTEG